MWEFGVKEIDEKKNWGFILSAEGHATSSATYINT